MCKYDHIAMIAKLGDDQIYLFETSPYESDFSSSYNNQNSRAKVMLTGWKKFRASNYDKLYRKIAFRHLHFSRNERFYELISKYITEMLGVKAISKRKNGSSIDFDELEGVYCAELIGSAYQMLGLLSTDLDTTLLIPGIPYIAETDSFQQSRDSKLTEFIKRGTSLDDEYLIDLHLR